MPVPAVDPPVSRLDAVGLVLAVLCATLLGDGALLLWLGPTSLFAPVGAAAGVPAALTAAGGLGLAVLGATRGRSLGRALRGTVPRLFPFGSVAVSIAAFLLIFGVIASFFHAFLDVFTGADNGGQVTALANQTVLTIVSWLAYGIVVLLAVYAALLVQRVVRMGMVVDARRGRDPYRRSPAPSAPPEPAAADPTPPPTRPYARPVLYSVALIVALGMSVATQVIETGLEPAAPVNWLGAQAFTPLWAAATALVVEYIDRGLRGLEARYRAALGSATEVARPSGGPAL